MNGFDSFCADFAFCEQLRLRILRSACSGWRLVTMRSLSSGSHQPRQYEYHTWKGNNRFFCGGRLMAGPDWPNAVMTAATISVPATIFTVFIGVDLLNSADWVWPLVVVPSLTVLSLILLVMTACSDPGVIPRSAVASGSISSIRVPKRVQDVLVDGRLVRLKWCETCCIFRPPRCSHCSVCDNCCENFDHHCPWVGNCIGKRNYRSFVLFLFTSTVLAGTVLLMSVWHMIRFPARLQSGNPAALILSLYTFSAFLFVFGLFLFHAYLLANGTTTNEKLKQSFPEGSPFSKGALRNALSFLCTLPHKRNFEPRRPIESERTVSCVHRDCESAPVEHRNSLLSEPPRYSDERSEGHRFGNGGEDCNSSQVRLDERHAQDLEEREARESSPISKNRSSVDVALDLHTEGHRRKVKAKAKAAVQDYDASKPSKAAAIVSKRALPSSVRML